MRAEWMKRDSETKSKQTSGWQRAARYAAGAMILSVFWSGCAPALRGQGSTLPTEDHLAIAAQYRQEAAEMREAIKRRQIMIDIYSRGSEGPYTVFNPQGRQQMVQHCKRVIAYYTEAAMAEAHETISKQPRSPMRADEQK